MSGDRTFGWLDTFYIKDERNSLYAEIVFNPDKKSRLRSIFSRKNNEEKTDYFEGVITQKENIDYKKNRSKLKQGTDYINFVNGYWTEELWIDGVKYWDFNEYRGFKIRPTNDPLPSDCRFREDLVHFKSGDETEGQAWKEELEKRQRHDEKLRKAAEKRQDLQMKQNKKKK